MFSLPTLTLHTPKQTTTVRADQLARILVLARMLTEISLASIIFKDRGFLSPKAFQRIQRLMAVVSPVIPLGLPPWKAPRLYQIGVQLGLTSRRKVVTKDAPNLGWGALCEGSSVFGSWSRLKQCLNINCLKMVIFRALKTLMPALKGHHVIVHSDNTTVVAFINLQG